jgi:hypothetical protein
LKSRKISGIAKIEIKTDATKTKMKKVIKPSDRLKPTDKINLDNGMIRAIARAKGCHESTVSEAIKRPRNTKLQREIRELAVDFYGGTF